MSELAHLIDQHPNVRLCSSSELYPGSKGEGLSLLVIEGPLSKAVIALQGAQLLSFQPVGGSELLWLSPNCNFTPGASLRGGVPICLPWFGVNRQDPNKPKHGFARNLEWQLSELTETPKGGFELRFALESEANELFEHAFSAELHLRLDATAALNLTVKNRSQEAFDCSWALHSYFSVTDLSQAKVKGLAGREYLDNLEAFAAKQQIDDLEFEGEVDRVFPGIDNALAVMGGPVIAIAHYQCPSVITWNPGAQKAAGMADVGPGKERGFVCVERGAVLNEQWRLTAGETRTGGLEISEISAKQMESLFEHSQVVQATTAKTQEREPS